MTRAEFAVRIGRAEETIDEIVQGKGAIDPGFALEIERVLGVPAGFWLAREQRYRESMARRRLANDSR